MVVWTGVRIALSGNFQPWEVIKLIIGLWIPWAMLNFYATPLPPPADAFTFPGVIVGGGNWLMDFFIADINTAMRTELSIMVNTHLTGIHEAWDAYDLYDLMTSGAGALSTLFNGYGDVDFRGELSGFCSITSPTRRCSGRRLRLPFSFFWDRCSSPGCCLSRCRFCSVAGSDP